MGNTITLGTNGYELDGAPLRDGEVLELDAGTLDVALLPKSDAYRLVDAYWRELPFTVHPGAVWAYPVSEGDVEGAGLFLVAKPGGEWNGRDLGTPFGCKPLVRAVAEGWRFRRVSTLTK